MSSLQLPAKYPQLPAKLRASYDVITHTELRDNLKNTWGVSKERRFTIFPDIGITCFSHTLGGFPAPGNIPWVYRYNKASRYILCVQVGGCRITHGLRSGTESPKAQNDQGKRRSHSATPTRSTRHSCICNVAYSCDAKTPESAACWLPPM